jgi:flavin reductase (DIM6/NTAB) family NADH-FMN oxidoreductase RutF
MSTINPAHFRRACGQFPTGVCIATTFDGAPHGLTVNSFTSVSLEPPVVLFCIDHGAQVREVFRRQTHFAINILSQQQQEISTAFAYRRDDRFEGVAWRPGVSSVPVIEGSVATIECRLVDVVPVGDHDIFLGEAVAVSVEDGEPLVYARGGYAKLEG